MHAISFNFPSSFDHFEGGLGDFPYQEGTRILHTPPLPRKTLMSLMVKYPSLDLYTNFKRSHSAPCIYSRNIYKYCMETLKIGYFQGQ